MKKCTFIILSCLLAASLGLAACSSKTDTTQGPAKTTQGPLSATGLAVKQVITGFWTAFNKFDEQTCLSYVAPDYVTAYTPTLESDLNSFSAGKDYKVSMVPTLFSEPVDVGDGTGRLGVRVTVSIVPSGLSADQYLLYYVENVNGTWMIDKQTTDRSKSVPRAPANLVCTIISVHEVDLTWTSSSTRTTTTTSASTTAVTTTTAATTTIATTTTATSTTTTNPALSISRPPTLGYKVLRSTDPQFLKDTKTFTVGITVLSYKDTSTKAGVLYYYKVMAYNINGDSASTSVVTLQMPKS
jgi:hypothetical protein